MSVLLHRRVSTRGDHAPIDILVQQIGKLVRHRGYARANVVSAILLRYLPAQADYAWSGEAALHARLSKVALDPMTLEHLIASARLEIVRIQERARD